VVGTGAIGGFIASGLANAGIETSVLARGATLSALRAHGLRVESADGTIANTTKVYASDDAAELGEQDAVVLAVKAQSAPAAAATMGPLLGADTIVLPTMNGVPWWFFDGFGGPCAGRHLDSARHWQRVRADPRRRLHDSNEGGAVRCGHFPDTS
jgi:2-dehydropantoate 2-reductase